MDTNFQVIVEAWENQRYKVRFRCMYYQTPNEPKNQSKPLQGGWQGPWSTETMPFFSDVSGEISIPHESNRPLVGLPLGWVWYTDGWDVDLTQSHGNVDSEGWSYASSFDFLVESSLKKRLDGEMGRLSLVRRRRWIRRRVCVTNKAKELFQEHVIWAQKIRGNLEAIVATQDNYNLHLLEYETQRKKIFEAVLADAESSLHETVRILGKITDKLFLMKSFLLERGALERDYSQRLDALSLKWSRAGVADPRSNRNNGAGSTSATQTANPGFFFAISSASRSVAARLLDFSKILFSSLPSDVECIVAEVASIQQDCQREGPKLRHLLKSKEDFLQRNFTSYSSAVNSSRSHAITKSAEYLSSLYEAGAADFILWPQASSADPSVPPPPTPTSSYLASQVLPITLPGHKYPTDVWMAVQRYKRAAVEADGSLYIYHAFSSQQRRETRIASQRVVALLNATIKVFAHEQSRVWEDASAMLKKLSLGQGARGMGAGGSSSRAGRGRAGKGGKGKKETAESMSTVMLASSSSSSSSKSSAVRGDESADGKFQRLPADCGVSSRQESDYRDRMSRVTEGAANQANEFVGVDEEDDDDEESEEGEGEGEGDENEERNEEGEVEGQGDDDTAGARRGSESRDVLTLGGETMPVLLPCGGVALCGRLQFAHVEREMWRANAQALSLSADPSTAVRTSSSSSSSSSTSSSGGGRGSSVDVTWHEATAIISKGGIMYFFPVQDLAPGQQELWVTDEPFMSFNLQAVEAVPALLPIGGVVDVLELRQRPPQHPMATAPTAKEGAGSPPPPILFLRVLDGNDSQAWTRVIAQPIADPADEPPETMLTATEILAQQQLLLSTVVQPAVSQGCCEK